MMRTKEELNKEVSSVFGLKTSLGSDYIDLITPTNIFLVRLGIFNRGTDQQPYWKIGGISNLPPIGYTWGDLISL